MSIKLYYEIYKNGNLGDLLTKDIFTQLFNIPIEIGTLNDSECIGIGSVLQHFLHNKSNSRTINVWGSGFIEEKKTYSEKFINNMNFLAVRGEYTKNRLVEMYDRDFSNVTLGDPGLLSPMLIDKKIIKKHTLGIIPHYIDSENPVFEKIKSSISNSTIINPLGDPIETIKQISECELIISTSLHGLVVADGFGIPNYWCEVSKNVAGDGYKFNDYYSVYKNIDKKSPIQLLDIQKFDKQFMGKIKKVYDLNYNNILEVRDNLINSFPYHNYCENIINNPDESKNDENSNNKDTNQNKKWAWFKKYGFSERLHST